MANLFAVMTQLWPRKHAGYKPQGLERRWKLTGVWDIYRGLSCWTSGPPFYLIRLQFFSFANVSCTFLIDVLEKVIFWNASHSSCIFLKDKCLLGTMLSRNSETLLRLRFPWPNNELWLCQTFGTRLDLTVDDNNVAFCQTHKSSKKITSFKYLLYIQYMLSKLCAYKWNHVNECMIAPLQHCHPGLEMSSAILIIKRCSGSISSSVLRSVQLSGDNAKSTLLKLLFFYKRWTGLFTGL